MKRILVFVFVAAFATPHVQAGGGNVTSSVGGSQTSTVYDQMVRLKGPGNMLGPMYDSVTTYVGREETTVPAGTFEVDHFKVESGVDMYVMGPDLILVKFVWPAADQEYVLTSLEQGQ